MLKIRASLADTHIMSRHKLRICTSNEVIFREGDDGDCAYLIETGRVLVYINKDGIEYPLRVFGSGEVFGEMALIDNFPRSASCRALEATRLIVVSSDQLLDRIRMADSVVRLLMRALLARIRFGNDAVRGKVSTTAPSPEAEDERKKALAQIQLENRIAAGLHNDEFIPWYQPIYDLNSKTILGFEALLRWITKDGVVTSPAVFIDVMENSSLIIDAGRKVLEKALKSLSEIQKIKPDLFMSVNVSGRQFSDPDFLGQLESIRLENKLSASLIKLEVTERVLMEGPLALPTMQKCHDLGYQLAIDDFGTGFSSLQYLASMPLHDLKIDRSFVSRMNGDAKAEAIVEVLIYLANLLGMKVIAEGIETEEQLQKLLKFGVTLGQGYLMNKPMAIEHILKLISPVASRAA